MATSDTKTKCAIEKDVALIPYKHSPHAQRLEIQGKRTHSVKLSKKRGESSKRTADDYYIISPRVIMKAIIITWRGRKH